MSQLITAAAQSALGIAVFVFPGWILARRLPNPIPIATAFAGSAVILFNWLLLLTLCGTRLDSWSVGAGLAGTGMLLWWKLPSSGASDRDAGIPIKRVSVLWWIPVAIGVASLVARVTLDPLSGEDNSFRWDYMARLLVQRGSLAGYPPVSPRDFELFAYCDGIPPLASFLNFWLYVSAGTVAPILTSIRVAAEAGLIGYTVVRFGNALWANRSGTVCVAALCSSAVFVWAVAMGQETGLTSLAFVALLLFLHREANGGRAVNAFWAGVAAAMGALSREYGLAFVLFGLGGLLARKAERRTILVFLGTAVALAAPWYVRNWILTGNPVYPEPLGRLFAGNAMRMEIARSVGREWGFATAPYSTMLLLKAVAATAGLILGFAAVGAARLGRKSITIVAGIGLIFALWLWSVPQTGGGWYYTLRVLAPGMAAGAVLCGWIADVHRFVRIALLAVCVAWAGDAARRSWFLPASPMTSVLPWSFEGWSARRLVLEEIKETKVCAILVQAAAGEGIVVQHPLYHPIIAADGGRPIALTSPILAPTLRATIPFRDVLTRLRRDNVRFILLSPSSQLLADLAADYPFWHELVNVRRPIVRTRYLDIYDLAAMAEPAAK